MRLLIDIETKSGADLKKCGTHKYVEHPEFEILLLACKLDDAPIIVLDLKNEPHSLSQIKPLLLNKDVELCAFNVDFELTCLTKIVPELEWSKPRWFDVQTQALYLGLPGGLDKILTVLKMQRKLSAGTLLINKFCVPKGAGYDKKYNQLAPKLKDDWNLFKEYAYNDVEVEYMLMKELEKRIAPWPITSFEKKVDNLSDSINRQGVCVDIDFTKWLHSMYESLILTTKIELCNLTQLANPNSTVQFGGWLASKGIKVNSVDRATLSSIKNSIPKDIAKAIELKLDMSSSVPKKYLAAINYSMTDNRMRGLFKYYGASRTGRWTSSGYQLHNLARTNHEIAIELEKLYKANASFKEVLKVLDDLKEKTGLARGTIMGQCVRYILKPAEDKVFYISDFSAIEARVAAWLAGEEWVLDTFRGDGKIYERTAAAMFNVPVESIEHDSIERRKGKYAVLALGYEGGVNALCNFGADEFMAPDEMQDLVTMWRQANPNIVVFWRKLERGFRDAFNRPNEIIKVSEHISFNYQPNSEVMFLILPSGRALCYFRPQVNRQEIKYLNTLLGHAGATDTTYGGKLMENVCQAVARDLLANYIYELYKDGFYTSIHVHDEVVVEAWDTEDKDEDIQIVKYCGKIVPDWAKGLPLDVEVEESKFYKK